MMAVVSPPALTVERERPRTVLSLMISGLSRLARRNLARRASCIASGSFLFSSVAVVAEGEGDGGRGLVVPAAFAEP